MVELCGVIDEESFIRHIKLCKKNSPKAARELADVHKSFGQKLKEKYEQSVQSEIQKQRTSTLDDLGKVLSNCHFGKKSLPKSATAAELRRELNARRKDIREIASKIEELKK